MELLFGIFLSLCLVVWGDTVDLTPEQQNWKGDPNRMPGRVTKSDSSSLAVGIGVGVGTFILLVALMAVLIINKIRNMRAKRHLERSMDDPTHVHTYDEVEADSGEGEENKNNVEHVEDVRYTNMEEKKQNITEMSIMNCGNEPSTMNYENEPSMMTYDNHPSKMNYEESSMVTYENHPSMMSHENEPSMTYENHPFNYENGQSTMNSENEPSNMDIENESAVISNTVTNEPEINSITEELHQGIDESVAQIEDDLPPPPPYQNTQADQYEEEIIPMKEITSSDLPEPPDNVSDNDEEEIGVDDEQFQEVNGKTDEDIEEVDEVTYELNKDEDQPEAESNGKEWNSNDQDDDNTADYSTENGFIQTEDENVETTFVNETIPYKNSVNVTESKKENNGGFWMPPPLKADDIVIISKS